MGQEIDKPVSPNETGGDSPLSELPPGELEAKAAEARAARRTTFDELHHSRRVLERDFHPPESVVDPQLPDESHTRFQDLSPEQQSDLAHARARERSAEIRQHTFRGSSGHRYVPGHGIKTPFDR